MRRVVVTGLGIVSSIGNNASEVLESLKAGRSGITANEDMKEYGFRSQIAGDIKGLSLADMIDKRTLRFMGPGAAYAYLAMEQAIADAGLDQSLVSNERTGLVAGSGGPSTSSMFAAHQVVLKAGSPKRIGPLAVPKCMSSTISANLSTAYKIKGINYSITSACSTSLHCIGNAAEQIMMGKQDVMFAGGGEALKSDRKVSYINAHGTSTPVGDVGEIEAVRRVFGQGSTPPVSSTKSMTGHSQGATGAQEAIYCLLMLDNDFIAPSINVETLDPALDPAEIATSLVENAGLDTVMTNSFGFGGTNGSMLMSKYRG
ncbi:MAG: hypothetical protein EBY58_03555 [Rhodobacteraceae bacterium]|nr:hypothetical protein [Paracoccaceae bacterium]